MLCSNGIFDSPYHTLSYQCPRLAAFIGGYRNIYLETLLLYVCDWYFHRISDCHTIGKCWKIKIVLPNEAEFCEIRNGAFVWRNERFETEKNSVRKMENFWIINIYRKTRNCCRVSALFFDFTSFVIFGVVLVVFCYGYYAERNSLVKMINEFEMESFYQFWIECWLIWEKFQCSRSCKIIMNSFEFIISLRFPLFQLPFFRNQIYPW